MTTCMGNCCSPGCRLWSLWLCFFVLSFFPRGVLDEILNLIESVSEGFPSYSFKFNCHFLRRSKYLTVNIFILIYPAHVHKLMFVNIEFWLKKWKFSYVKCMKISAWIETVFLLMKLNVLQRDSIETITLNWSLWDFIDYQKIVPISENQKKIIANFVAYKQSGH